MSKGFRAPIEQLYRAAIKHFFLNETPPAAGPVPEGRFGATRVLPPQLSEMGAEIRYHVARVEPWLRNGWKVLTRRPALYPEGTTVEAPEFFAAADAILNQYSVLGSLGGLHIPPLELGAINLDTNYNGRKGRINVALDDITKVTTQALVEIELRKLFIEWFHFAGRPITDIDRYLLSFASTASGNWEYHCGAALRPGFLPPSFVTPSEPAPDHVGVQMRHMTHYVPQPRNSDPDWMMKTAHALAAHLGLPLLVYGHPNGCHIPTGENATWDPSRPQGHMPRELGFLKSCRIMLSPDSGWADLMAWLEIPTLLEMQLHPGEYESLRSGFRPRMRVADRSIPIGAQADELIAATQSILPDEGKQTLVNPRLFPWEP